MWTLFWDMHSGGGTKEGNYDKIYIEAPEEEAKIIFYNRFGHNAERVSCTCCGSDYSISESETLEEASGYHRNCRYVYTDKATGKGSYVEEADPERNWAPYIPLAKYLKSNTVLVVRASEIKPEERKGDVPEQGYVWRD